MSANLNDSTQVMRIVNDLRWQGITLIIVDPLQERIRGSTTLAAIADNIIDVRDGKITFLKRKNS